MQSHVTLAVYELAATQACDERAVLAASALNPPWQAAHTAAATSRVLGGLKLIVPRPAIAGVVR